MATNSKKQILKKIKQRRYLNKDFYGFKRDLNDFAATLYPNNVRDLSEPGVAGMLLELAAYVGDVDSFYLDHQFHELNLDTAVETKNIEAHLKNAGVDIVGAAPAVVEQSFLVEVPAGTNQGSQAPEPLTAALPIIQEGTVVPSDTGVQFELTEDVNFNERDQAGNLTADITIGQTDANNNPTTFILSKKGICISGFRETESFSFGQFEPFKKIPLSRENITEIISVSDNLGNDYYETGFLTQDTVFEALLNRSSDNELVKDLLVIKPAPFRFISRTDLNTRLTTLTFGGGTAESLDDDIVPDPSEFSLPLFGKRNFSRFTLNPSNLLRTTTLGVVAPNSTVVVNYRFGGGLSHNVSPRSIRGFSTLLMEFPNDPTASTAQFVRSSADSVNETAAAGGEDAPTIEELKLRAPAVKSAQARIVTKEDLLARIYTMPSNFGRVFRAAVRPDPVNPLSTRIYIISRNSNSELVISPDSLKENISTYLNQFRLSNDAYDILDAQIVNIGISFTIVADPGFNKNLIKQNVISKLVKYFGIKNFEIDQPIIINDIENIIFNNTGVLSITDLTFSNIHGSVSSGADGDSNVRVYSEVQYDLETNTDRKIIFPPTGGIFELRMPNFDIEGVVL